MRPLWFMTHAVVDRMEEDPEFAGFVHESEARFREMRFYKVADDEPIEITYRKTGHPDWTIRFVTTWDRFRTIICFPWEDVEDD